MNVLVIGSGAREHCLAHALSLSEKAQDIFLIPGNAGTATFAKNLNIGIDEKSFPLIEEAIKKHDIGMTVVGPEAPLVAGIVDYLEKRGHRVFGPDKKASVIEASKIFVKKLCKKYNIATAPFQIFLREEADKAKDYLRSLDSASFPIVIKADGLASGKGVIIAKTKEESLLAIEDIFIKDVFGDSGDSIVIEQYIDGFEVSILCLCDGKDIIPLRLAQDYKKIFDSDLGKNTGGMGSYSPVPFVEESLYTQILDDIIFRTYDALKSEGIEYKGVLYGGIIVRDNIPYLLEYNCRFGDPETQAVLPALKNDLLVLLENTIASKLAGTVLEWEDQKTVCVVIASKGYPESSSNGDLIEGIEKITNGSLVFHAGTRIDSNQIVTNGGRVLSVVASAPTFCQARKDVYDAIKNIAFDGMQFRKDIALKVSEAQPK